MRRQASVVKVLFLLIAALPLLSCGGKGGGSDAQPLPTPPPVQPILQCADSPVAANQVALRCGPRISIDIFEIDVVIGSTSSEIYGLDFVVSFDPALVRYVPGSALSGNFLNLDGEVQFLAATTKPGSPGDLEVGISRTGGVAGVVPSTGHDRVMSFRLQRVAPTAFDMTMPTFKNAEALDSQTPSAVIPSITFSDQLTLSYQ